MTNENVLRRFAGLVIVFGLLFECGVPSGVAQAPAKLVVSNAYIFSMAPNQRAPFRGYLVVGEDGRLTAVAAGDPPTSLKAAAMSFWCIRPPYPFPTLAWVMRVAN